jgi:uncharacterized membrane protein YphA (DoxX/SURF4 family)
LLLRTVAGVVALVQGGAIAFGPGTSGPVAWLTALLAVASGAALLVGFVTPIASALVALGGAVVTLDMARSASVDLLADPLAALLVVTIAVATACLGPGAFSLDAWLFGRREVLIRR